jgi:4-hydroxybenzoyl-CoA reductase subunit beta
LDKLATLKRICEIDGVVTIGSLTTMAELIDAPLIQAKFPGLVQAAREVGSPLHRILATIGGNLCLDTRCRFYNQSSFWRSSLPRCCKMGGEVCHVTNKQNACFATYAGDLAPLLISLRATIKLASYQGERVLPLEQFYTGNGRRPNQTNDTEILTEIQIPAPADGVAGTYKKYRERESIDFPVVGIAVALQMEQPTGVCHDLKIVITAAGSRPIEASLAAKKLMGQVLSSEFIKEAAAKAAEEIRPVKTDQVAPNFKRQITSLLVEETIKELGGIGQ